MNNSDVVSRLRLNWLVKYFKNRKCTVNRKVAVKLIERVKCVAVFSLVKDKRNTTAAICALDVYFNRATFGAARI